MLNLLSKCKCSHEEISVYIPVLFIVVMFTTTCFKVIGYLTWDWGCIDAIQGVVGYKCNTSGLFYSEVKLLDIGVFVLATVELLACLWIFVASFSIVKRKNKDGKRMCSRQLIYMSFAFFSSQMLSFIMFILIQSKFVVIGWSAMLFCAAGFVMFCVFAICLVCVVLLHSCRCTSERTHDLVDKVKQHFDDNT